MSLGRFKWRARDDLKIHDTRFLLVWEWVQPMVSVKLSTEDRLDFVQQVVEFGFRKRFPPFNPELRFPGFLKEDVESIMGAEDCARCDVVRLVLSDIADGSDYDAQEGLLGSWEENALENIGLVNRKVWGRFLKHSAKAKFASDIVKMDVLVIERRPFADCGAIDILPCR